MQLEWQWLKFGDLAVQDLYDLLKARQAVFVVEQDCAYQDVDDLDQSAWHLLGWKRNSERDLVAYLRVVFPGEKYAEPSIGRVLTSLSVRQLGVGKASMVQALAHIAREYPDQPIRISAQQHLSNFYADFGFEPVSEPYDEDGIPHIEMLRTGSQ